MDLGAAPGATINNSTILPGVPQGGFTTVRYDLQRGRAGGRQYLPPWPELSVRAGSSGRALLSLAT